MSSGAMRLALLGPPGVGKGTQAKTIAREWSLPHISTGDMFRAAIAAGTDAGRAARKFLEAGELVPDAVVTAMVRERLAAADSANGFLLDGFPRTRAQAESLDVMLRELGGGLSAVLYLTGAEEVIVDRLSGRRLCRKCGANYHARHMPPKRESVCDKCGGELYQREDDRAEKIRTRLRVYAAQTAELVDYYRGRSLLREVAGDAGVEEVAAAVRGELERLAAPAARGQEK